MNCKKASYLIDKKQLSGLKLSEKIALKFHQLMCKICKLHEKESRIMSKKLSDFKFKEIQLSAEEKKKMQDKINR